MNRIFPAFVLLSLALPLPAAGFAADLRTRTVADVTGSDGRLLQTSVDVIAEIAVESLPMLSRDDVVVSWRRAGGVEPQPFRIVIPRGCFVEVRSVFRVRDPACGVELSLDGTRIPADDFAARLVPPDPIVPPEPVFPPEPIRLRIRLAVSLPPAATAGLISTLGGAAVIVQVGAERGVSVAKRIESISGISPTPF